VGNVTVTLRKSLIGYKKDQIATAHALGLKKVGDVSVQPLNGQTRGKLLKIQHLVSVSEH
jgi:large subunit ribosomal protein L30